MKWDGHLNEAMNMDSEGIDKESGLRVTLHKDLPLSAEREGNFSTKYKSRGLFQALAVPAKAIVFCQVAGKCQVSVDRGI